MVTVICRICKTMTKERVSLLTTMTRSHHFFEAKRVTPSVTAQGDTSISDATVVPYWTRAFGLRADPDLQAVSLQLL